MYWTRLGKSTCWQLQLHWDPSLCFSDEVFLYYLFLSPCHSCWTSRTHRTVRKQLHSFPRRLQYSLRGAGSFLPSGMRPVAGATDFQDNAWTTRSSLVPSVNTKDLVPVVRSHISLNAGLPSPPHLGQTGSTFSTWSFSSPFFAHPVPRVPGWALQREEREGAGRFLPDGCCSALLMPRSFLALAGD